MEILKEWFENNGVKQSFIAKKMGVSRQSVNYWVQGQCFPNGKYIPKLSEITGIPIEKLLGMQELSQNCLISSLGQKSHSGAIIVPNKIYFDYGTGQFKNITDTYLAVLSKSYPTVNLTQELDKMAAWLFSNQTKRKSNFERFINMWLNKVNNRITLPLNPSFKQQDENKQAEIVKNLLNKFEREDNTNGQKRIDDNLNKDI